MTLTFQTMPPSTNHMYRRTSRGVSLIDSVRQAKEDIAWEARSQFRGKPLSGPLAIEVTFFWGDRRKHDWDNQKAFFDALNGIVWTDDGQVKDAHVMVEFDKEHPHVELRVWELS